MNKSLVLKNIQVAGEITKYVLTSIKKNKYNFDRSELSQLNKLFTDLDNPVNNLFFIIDKMNKEQILKDDLLNYKNGKCTK